MPFPFTRTTGSTYCFHRWESISVRGPSLRLDTKPFCVHQGDAPGGAVFPFPQWRGSAFGGNNQSTTASALEGGASGGSRKCEMSTLYGRISFPTRELARMGAGFIDATLTALGLKRSIKKSVWKPTQQLRHLGLLVDFQRGLFLVPPAAVRSIQQQAKQLLISATDTTARVAVRRLGAFAGKIASVDLACSLARFRTRAIHDCVAVVPHWEAHVRLSRAATWTGGFTSTCRLRSGPSGRLPVRGFCTQTLRARLVGRRCWTVPASGFWRSHQQHILAHYPQGAEGSALRGGVLHAGARQPHRPAVRGQPGSGGHPHIGHQPEPGAHAESPASSSTFAA
jgi:hypothetical protein